MDSIEPEETPLETKTETSREKHSKRPKDEDDDSRNSHKRERRSRSRSRSRDRYRSKRRYRDLDQSEEDYPRYYGDKKENNDTYWTKYPKKDDNVVGSRYYEDKKKSEEKDPQPPVAPPKQRKNVDLLTSRTGGAYIPPAKLRLMQAEITDKTSAAYQRIAWEALKKSIHGCINKVNVGNLNIISLELLRENIVRGRGLLCKSIIQAQAASPTFTNVYAGLVAVINSKFPNIGDLLVKRLILQFKRSFKQNNKAVCISSSTFIAHLVNQQVAHEILALEILTLLLESPTDDSVEVGIAFLKECGQKLMEMSSKGINGIFEILRNILHEGKLEKRIQYMIEVMFQIRKDGFKDHAAVIPDLDEVDEKDQITHLFTLEDVKANQTEDVLNVFKYDENYKENEDKYDAIKNEILEDDNSDESGSESGSDDEEGEEGVETEKPEGEIIDNTSTNLLALRRNIYLTIQSSLDFEECAHKLLKMEIKPGQEIEMCHMFLDCCAEQRTYEKFYGLLSQRFCQINKIYVEPFQQIFKDTYATTHRLDTNRLRNVSKFFAHLLFTDGISWEVMEVIQLTETDTNSSSRIFIKTLFQELAEYMGLKKLNVRLKDPTLQEVFSGLFPRDNPRNTRFAINFFTTIGLGGLTDELRQHLATQVSESNAKNIDVEDSEDAKSKSSEDESDSSDSDSSSSSSSESSSEDEKRKKKKSKQKNKKSKERNNSSKESRKEDKTSQYGKATKRDESEKRKESSKHDNSNELSKRYESKKRDEPLRRDRAQKRDDFEKDNRSRRNDEKRKNDNGSIRQNDSQKGYHDSRRHRDELHVHRDRSRSKERREYRRS